MEMKELAELLNQEDTSFDFGQKVCQALCNSFNCFGSYKDKMQQLTAELNIQGYRNFQLFMCVAALSLAQRYAATDSWWDDRNKASGIFAYENREYFEAGFYYLTGFKAEIIDEKMAWFPRAIHTKTWYDNGADYLLGFAEKWGNEHSTLQQAVMGGYVRGILSKVNPKMFENYSFPFI